MSIDIEEALSRELREVAEGLQIPAMPPLPQKRPRAARHWQPLLVAAAVVLLIAGAVAVVATWRSGQGPEPVQPSPTPIESAPPDRSPSPPGQTKSVAELPRTAPTVPYVLERRLYVDGEQVPGAWWSVWVSEDAWLAIRTDNTWWWGTGPEPNPITGQSYVPPVMSPNGMYVAVARTENGEGVLTGFATTGGGERLGSVPVALGDPQDGSTVSIRAVTNDGKVIAQGTETSLLWLPLAGNDSVDLAGTAPGKVILGGTSAGLIVTDGDGGEPYLAEISGAGELTRIGAVPAHDDIMVSPGAEWLVWTSPGTTGGEVMSIPALEAQTLDGGQQTRLTAPAGWGFRVRAWAWEDDDHLISLVLRDGGERMARCSVEAGRCALIDSR